MNTGFINSGFYDGAVGSDVAGFSSPARLPGSFHRVPPPVQTHAVRWVGDTTGLHSLIKLTLLSSLGPQSPP